MTRKDYVKFARVLRGIKPQNNGNVREYELRLSQWERMIEVIANILEDDNERFNRQKFYKEVGYV